MTPDAVERMLRRVVRDVFGEDVDAVWDTEPRAPHVHRVRLSSRHGGGRRTVGLRASASGWFDLHVLDLGVEATLYEYDDESCMEAVLRDLARVARACLHGEGRLEQRRALLRTRQVLVVPVDGNEWTLGRRTSRVHYPQVPPA